MNEYLSSLSLNSYYSSLSHISNLNFIYEYIYKKGLTCSTSSIFYNFLYFIWTTTVQHLVVFKIKYDLDPAETKYTLRRFLSTRAQN